MNLRQKAKDEACSMCGRLDGTTVLHHIRVGGNAGMGMKPPDFPYGVCLCFGCHSWVHGDGRADYKLQLMALCRQMERYVADGTVVLS